MRPAERRANAYRDYGERDVHELRFIRRARRLGFSTGEIGALLALWRDRARPSRDVRRIAERHVEDLQARIAEMQAMAKTLGDLVHACCGDDRPDCPILDDLAGRSRGRRSLLRTAIHSAMTPAHDLNAPSPQRNWLAEIQPTVRDAAASGIVEVFDYGRGRQGLIPLWVGEGDLPPPAIVGEAAKASLDRGETFYTYQAGIPPLREAIAAYMTRVYGAAPGGGPSGPRASSPRSAACMRSRSPSA